MSRIVVGLANRLQQKISICNELFIFRIPPQVIFHKNRKHVRCGSVELSWKCFGPISPTDQDESHCEPRTKSPQREAFRVRERRVDGGRERRIETRRKGDGEMERWREIEMEREIDG